MKRRFLRNVLSDVAVSNDSGLIYLSGNGQTDGSVRLLSLTPEDTELILQIRVDGEWEDVEIKLKPKP